MGVFHGYPYTNFHDLNLDWILQKMGEFSDKLENFISLATIKYANPFSWNIALQYEKNTIVIDASSKTAYLSIQNVPQGVPITNTDYWTPVADISGIFQQLVDAITGMKYYNFGAPASETIEFGSLVWIGGKLYICTAEVEQGQNITEQNFKYTNLDKEFKRLVEQYEDLIQNTTKNLNARLSAIIANGQQTDGNTELIDIRTGWNGTVYATAGDAVRAQALEALKASEIAIGLSTYQDYFRDANNAPKNQVYFISNAITSAMISNLPFYGQYGLLYTISYSSTSDHGFVQYYINLDTGDVWNRAEVGSGQSYNFTEWNVTVNKKSVFGPSYIHISAATYQNYFTDANNAPKNQVYFISNAITSAMISNLPFYGQYGLLYTISYSSTSDHGFVQYYINLDTGDVWHRTETGYQSTYNYSGWSVGQTDQSVYKTMVSSNTVSIFRKVVCCGDSYTSGHIYYDKEVTETNENFAWPHYLELITGNKYVNCGRSGANVLTWQTDPRGLPAAQAAGKTQAYIIGLGLNDTAEGTGRYVPLGTPEDIGTNAETYYGGMSKIIRELNTISPMAKIFVQTMPNPSAIRKQYNDAIRTIVEQYKDTYPVFVLDLTNYEYLYDIPSITGDSSGGHYTALGYQQFAEILKIVISDFINGHITEFQNVHLIPIE